jgi:hypothetical protein
MNIKHVCLYIVQNLYTSEESLLLVESTYKAVAAL